MGPGPARRRCSLERLSLIEHSVLDKMRAKGTPLKDWDVNINYGIKTGYNKTFIIDSKTKDALVAADSKSAEIIKPVLRGKDIRRFRTEASGQWLIDTHNGFGTVPAIDVNKYPAVKAHLAAHYPRLEKRQDKGKTPYNLRNCAYHEEFSKEKLFWMDLTEYGRFAYDADDTFCLNTVYMISGPSVKYLCAILNASLATWFMQATALTSGMGVTRWFSGFVETTPIRKLSVAKQRPFVRLVDRILEAKAADPDADTEPLEREIDRLVYDLYGLTEVSLEEVRDL